MTKTFIPQKTIPARTDKYFLRTQKGGYSDCIMGKPELFNGSVLSNCVGYAWGRAAQLEGNPECNIGVPAFRWKAGCYAPVSAYAWMSYANGRKTGKTPKLGAVAVWKHKTRANYGHVAVVEEIYSDGSWLSSESSYKGTAFRNLKYNANSARNNFIFLGFIYLNVDFTPSQELEVGDKIQIVAKGNARKDGKGKTSYGIGWKRYILGYSAGEPFPYRIGNKLGVTTGYYAEDALKKVD